MKQFYVYVLTSRSGTLYVGVTNDLERRVFQHKQKRVPGFTARYNVTRLVFYEAFPDAMSAIAAEKKIKGWKRDKKVALVESMNPTWKDLAEGWFAPQSLLNGPPPNTPASPSAVPPHGSS